MSITAPTATPIHGAIEYADRPATDSTRKISSGAYATDDNASEAKTGSAIRFGNSVWASLSLRKGLPRTSRLAAVESLDTRAKSKPDGRWPSESGSVPSARVRHRQAGK